MNKNNVNFLIVDDFDVMQKIIKNTLVRKGFEHFSMATNGKEALAILKSSPIDIVISDWNMPIMNGLELLQHIREDNMLSNIPLLMITAETKQENINQAIDSGVNEFMIKPFTPVTLYKKIESILSGNSPIQQFRSGQDDNVSIRRNVSDIKKHKTVTQIKREKPEILVVDDLSSNIDIIIGFLKDTYKIRVANNGKKAIKIVESDTPPDLILLDIMMPEMDGISVCKHIKNSPLISHIPIIFLTAKTDQESLVEAFESGGTDYITKPVKACELKVRVKNHLALKFSHDELRDQVDVLIENARLRDDVERMSRHDLKTPISSLITLSSMLEDQAQVKLLGEESSENIKQIKSTAFLLMDMVNQSLNLYKIEMGTYNFSPKKTNIKEITAKVINDVNLLAKTQQVKIQVLYDEQAVYCLIEELLCYSLLSNILKNALEASENNSIVKVDIRQVEHDVFIKIHNNKVVPVEVRNAFFTKYITHGKSQGTGIGTYSARLLTEVQKGSITMKTDESLGTTITIKFSATEI
ncbi:MAG: hybrid sensor histidine kinase/response regulator [Pseudomonadota bacterium]